MSDLETFRSETREWLEANCPEEMRNLSFHWEDAHKIYSTDAADVWRQRMAEKGWIAPCLLYTSPSPRDVEESRMPSSA